MNGPHATVQLLQRIPLDGLLAPYPNAGYPKYTDGRFIYHAAGLFRAGRARNGRGRGAVDWLLLLNKSAHRRSDFESDRGTQAGESEGGDGDAAARSEGERPVHSGSRSPQTKANV
jgi:hypothetical protein